jgi:hypothetical protein
MSNPSNSICTVSIKNVIVLAYFYFYLRNNGYYYLAIIPWLRNTNRAGLHDFPSFIRLVNNTYLVMFFLLREGPGAAEGGGVAAVAEALVLPLAATCSGGGSEVTWTGLRLRDLLAKGRIAGTSSSYKNTKDTNCCQNGIQKHWTIGKLIL